MVMGLIMLIWYQFNKTDFILFGAITYLILSQGLRRIIAIEHRRGMAKVKSEDFDDAIPHFKNSYRIL